MAKRIMIVEDSQSISYLVDILMRSRGYDTVVSRSVKDSLNELKKRLPDLIILDLMMPEISGNDMFKLIKEDKRLRGIPVIILTAYSDALVKLPMLKNADDFITKPFDNEDLIRRVEKCLNRPNLKNAGRSKQTKK